MSVKSKRPTWTSVKTSLFQSSMHSCRQVKRYLKPWIILRSTGAVVRSSAKRLRDKGFATFAGVNKEPSKKKLRVAFYQPQTSLLMQIFSVARPLPKMELNVPRDVEKLALEALLSLPGLSLPHKLQLRRLGKTGSEAGFCNLGIFELFGATSREEEILIVKVVDRIQESDAQGLLDAVRHFPKLLEWENVILPFQIVRVGQPAIDILIMPKLPDTAKSVHQVLLELVACRENVSCASAEHSLDTILDEVAEFLRRLHMDVCPGRQHCDFNLDNVFYDATRNRGEKVFTIDNCGLGQLRQGVSDARFLYQEAVAHFPELACEVVHKAKQANLCTCKGCTRLIQWINCLG